MKRLGKWLLRSFAAVIALAAVAVIGALIARSVAQSPLEERLATVAPNGVDDELFVNGNRREHWISIRGHDRRNFVALSRKLAKVSFALLRTNAQFVPAMGENCFRRDIESIRRIISVLRGIRRMQCLSPGGIGETGQAVDQLNAAFAASNVSNTRFVLSVTVMVPRVPRSVQ